MSNQRQFRWSSALDALVITAILAGINYLWFRHDPAFRTWAIHPYLLPIALIGLFYGFREALMAVLLINVVYTAQLGMAGYPWTTLLERPDAQNVAAFLLAGLFFGEAGELYQRALRHHREKGVELETSLSKATDERDRLAVANKELQEWIRFGDVQLTEIHAAAPDLFSSDESKILETVAPLTLKILGADQCSLYWYDRSKNRFWRRYQAGRDGAPNPSTVSKDATPFAQLRQTGRLVSVKDVESFSTGVRFLAAAPITVQGAVAGALLLESMPLVRLTPYTLTNFGFLADLVNRSLDNAALLKQGEVTGERTVFRERMNQEVHASNRYKADLSLLYIDINDYDSYRSSLGTEGSRQLIDQVIRTVSKIKRKSDVLSYQGSGRFAVLMPQTSPEKTSAFVERTKDEIRSLKLPGDSPRQPDFSFQLGSSTLAQAGLNAGTDNPTEEPAGR